MDASEARRILRGRLQQYRGQSYTELQRLLANVDVSETKGPSGVRYQIEVYAVWDHKHGGNLRVLGTIGDGGWHALSSLVEDFILSPDGTYVGERERTESTNRIGCASNPNPKIADLSNVR